MFAPYLFTLLPSIGVFAQGLGRTSGSFQCFSGWYQEINDLQGTTTGQTWNLGEAIHQENTVCGGFGGSCPPNQATDMTEADAQRLVLASEASHYALTAYEIHDRSQSCSTPFCVQPLSEIYFKTRAFWPLLWRESDRGDLAKLCVRTQYPGYVWVQGYDIPFDGLNPTQFEEFKSLPTPDVIKLLDRVTALDPIVNGTGKYIGCFNTQGSIKSSCPMHQAETISGTGLDGIYIRTDYPDWIFVQGMDFTASGQFSPAPFLAYNIPKLLAECDAQGDSRSRCNVVNSKGKTDGFLNGVNQRFFYHQYSGQWKQLGGTWIRKSYAQALALGLQPQPTSF